MSESYIAVYLYLGYDEMTELLSAHKTLESAQKACREHSYSNGYRDEHWGQWGDLPETDNTIYVKVYDGQRHLGGHYRVVRVPFFADMTKDSE